MQEDVTNNFTAPKKRFFQFTQFFRGILIFFSVEFIWLLVASFMTNNRMHSLTQIEIYIISYFPWFLLALFFGLTITYWRKDRSMALGFLFGAILLLIAPFVILSIGSYYSEK